MTVVVCSLIAPQPQGQGAGDGVAAPAHAIARALLAHDQSVDSLEWDMSVYERTLLPPEVGNQDREWRWSSSDVFREGRNGEDANGNWYFHGRLGGRDDANSSIVFHPGSYVSSVEQTVAWSEGNNAYIISEPLQQPAYFPGPMYALGRWLDISGTERLGEILLSADVLEVQDVDSEEGLVMLRAELAIGNSPSVLLVTVDPKHGWAPLTIRRFDATYHHLAEEVLTTRFEQVDGTWLPAEGTRTLFSRRPLEPEQSRRLGEERDRIAEARGLGRDDSEVIQAATVEVFGVDGYPVTPLGGTMYRFEVTAFHSINRGLPDQFMICEIGSDAQVFNQMNGLDTGVASLTEVIADSDLIRVKVASNNDAGGPSASGDSK